MRPLSLFWLPCLVLLSSSLQAAQPLSSDDVDAVLKQGLKTWKAPGIAVAIVHGDKVLVARGAGVRRVDRKDPYTADTVQSIGSLTKAFAATTLGILVDEGKAGWDDHVRKHLPGFRMFDPLADKEVRLRDLFCHRTGLARNDWIWYRAPWSLEETTKRLAQLQPASSFRSRFEYNNLAYIVAGQAMAKAAKQPWNELTQKKVLDPLGMKNTVFTASAAKKLADHAMPHRRDDAGKLHLIDWYPDDKQVRASGSVKSSVRDLTGWLRMQLNQGKFGNKQIISALSLKETHTPHVVVPVERGPSKLTETTQRSYALGWYVYDYRGKKTLEHGGANDGFRARIILVPGEKLGMVILTNCEDNGLLLAVGNILLDRLLGLKEKDWHKEFLDLDGATRKARKAAKEKWLSSRKKGTKPSLALTGYAGTYRDKAYGDVTIGAKDGKLTLAWSSVTLPLKHFHYDTFVIEPSKGPLPGRYDDLPVTFTLDRTGKVGEVGFLERRFKRVK